MLPGGEGQAPCTDLCCFGLGLLSDVAFMCFQCLLSVHKLLSVHF